MYFTPDCSSQKLLKMHVQMFISLLGRTACHLRDILAQLLAIHQTSSMKNSVNM